MEAISAVCKRCNRKGAADSFVLDPLYKMVVCPACVKERKDKARISEELTRQKAAQPPAPSRPQGWDSDDEYLAQASKKKESSMVDLGIVKSERIKLACKKCKYQFAYDVEHNHPTSCPYCGMKLPEMKYQRGF